jgi:hypothetical protein
MRPVFPENWAWLSIPWNFRSRGSRNHFDDPYLQKDEAGAQATVSRSLADLLSSGRVRSVMCWPMGRVEGVFLDVVVSLDDRVVVISGEAIDVDNRTEAFILTADHILPNWPVSGSGDQSIWTPRDLVTTSTDSPLAELWSSPRIVKWYLDPKDIPRGLTRNGPLDSAAAIELIATSNDSARLVLYATPEYPCSVELATMPERSGAILTKLEEFSPPSVLAKWD